MKEVKRLLNTLVIANIFQCHECVYYSNIEGGHCNSRDIGVV